LRARLDVESYSPGPEPTYDDRIIAIAYECARERGTRRGWGSALRLERLGDGENEFRISRSALLRGDVGEEVGLNEKLFIPYSFLFNILYKFSIEYSSLLTFLGRVNRAT
jgi:hypothetical protein